MPDTAPAETEHHPFDPECRTRLKAFLAAVPKHAITIAIRPGASLRRPDLEQLLERDAYAEKTRLELAEACAKLRSERDELHAAAIAVSDLLECGPRRDIGGRDYVRADYVRLALDGHATQAPREPREVRLMRPDDAVRGMTSTCGSCGTQISVHGHDGLDVGYATNLGLRCGKCCDRRKVS